MDLQVLGMEVELALILAIMGTVWTGNPLALDPGFSIGGTVPGDGSDNLLGNLVGLLGTHLPKKETQNLKNIHANAST